MNRFTVELKIVMFVAKRECSSFPLIKKATAHTISELQKTRVTIDTNLAYSTVILNADLPDIQLESVEEV